MASSPASFRFFLNTAGEVLHKAAAEAQPIRIDSLELLLAQSHLAMCSLTALWPPSVARRGCLRKT
jgi:hypothetical protein